MAHEVMNAFIANLDKNGLDGKNFVDSMRDTLKYMEIPDIAYLIVNRSYQIVYCTDNYPALIEIDTSVNGIIGKTISNLIGEFLYDKDPSIIDKKCLASAINAFQTKSCVHSLRRLLSGKELMVYAKPILDRAGEVLCVLNSVINVTDVDQLRNKVTTFYEVLGINISSNFKVKMISESEVHKKTIARANRAAEFEANVLITGESGSGKDVLAKYIHFCSKRRNKRLIQINCSAIPESLLESELFGYEGGAFSGAKRKGKLGLLELANHSTIFLDEIGDIPLATQVKLLNFIQDRAFYRVGGTEKIEVDIRIIAATNADLRLKIDNNQFREDLYYRLNTIPISIAPLRNRREDIIPLIEQFEYESNLQYKMDKHFSIEAKSFLLSLDWPGNIREMQHCVERLMILTEKETIEVDDILADQQYDGKQKSTVHTNSDEDEGVLVKSLKAVEYHLLKKTAEEYDSSRKIAAVLGISHTAVNSKLAKYGIAINGKKKSQPGIL